MSGVPSARVVFLGNTGVGKSVLMLALTGTGRVDDVAPTIGVDYATETVMRGARSVSLRYWDTAGQERFRCLARSYVRNADVCVIVQASDASDEDSAEDLDLWHGVLKDDGGQSAAVVLCRNKNDIGDGVPGPLLARKMLVHGHRSYYATTATAERDPGVQLLRDKIVQMALESVDARDTRSHGADVLRKDDRPSKCC